ncbi:MAG: amino acid adenylation domain-containing protein, partial [Pseudomonadota bacterium]
MLQRERIQDIYPATGMQAGMLFHSMGGDRQGTYFVQARIRITGPLDAARFEEAWRRVQDNHDVLRTAFVWEDVPEPLQVVYRAGVLALDWTNLDWRGSTDVDDRFASLLEADYARDFDLKQAPLMRAKLVRVAPEEHYFVWSHHHIILDGWCLPRLVAEAIHYYEQPAGSEKAIPTRPFRDFVAWQQGQDRDAGRDYWRAYLDGLERATPLSFERHGLTLTDSRTYCEHNIALSLDLSAAIDTAVRRHRVTLNTFVVGAWLLLLGRYAQTNDVVCGATVAGRPPELAGSDEMVGVFINSLPVRTNIEADLSLEEFLSDLQRRSVASRAFEYTPLPEIQSMCDWAAGGGLFDSLVVFENFPNAALAAKELTLELLTFDDAHPAVRRSAERNNYPLTLVAIPGEPLSMILSFDSSHFATGAIASVGADLVGLLEQLANAPTDTPLGAIAIGRDIEPVPDVTIELDVMRAMRAHAERQPTFTAVAAGGASLSYRELQRLVGVIEQNLASRGVGPGDGVAICADASVDAVAAILGVMARGAYVVPLDPNWPARRVARLIERSGARLSVIDKAVDLSGPSCPLESLLQTQTGEPPQPVEHPNELWAYIIFTSGSTGEPKGVAISRRALNAYTQSITERLDLRPGQSFATLSTLGADLGFTALFGALASGGVAHLIPKTIATSPNDFADYNREHPLDWIKLTPSLLELLLSADESAAVLPRTGLALGGEALTPRLVEQVSRIDPKLTLVNHYGPTETTIGVCAHRVAARLDPPAGLSAIPIGKSLRHARAYVLDQAMQPLPRGIPGELFIGGPSVADGYVGSAVATALRFVPDPFATQPGRRMYRSGDEVFENAAGRCVFLGRKDGQLNLNGYRIEPGEIEATLRELDGVVDARVMASAESGSERAQLCAFIVSADPSVETTDWRAQLASRVPEHMIPDRWRTVPAWPLTDNGKVDVQALRAALHNASDRIESDQPADQLEEDLIGLWATILNRDAIGVDENFFELGGDSILSLQLVAKARSLGAKLTPRTLFDNPTIRSFAKAIREARGEAVEDESGRGDDRDETQTARGLSPIQSWFFESEPNGENHWNQALVFAVPSHVNDASLEQAIHATLAAHPVFRLRFQRDASGWQPSLSSDVVVEFARETVPHLDATLAAEAIHERCANAQQTLDITHGPLGRIILFELPGTTANRLFFCFHHLVIDAVSWRILLTEISARLSADRDPDPLPDEFLDWLGAPIPSAWITDRTYWSSMESRRLPTTLTAGANTIETIDTVSLRFGPRATRDLLIDAHRAYRTKLDELLLCAVSGALLTTFGVDGITIELERHGRDAIAELDLSGGVGWFTSRFPVTFSFPANDAWSDQIPSVKETLRAVPNNGHSYGGLRYASNSEARPTDGRPKNGPPPGHFPPDDFPPDDLPIQSIAADVSFNNLGTVDDVLGEGGWLRPSDQPIGALRSPNAVRRQFIDVTVQIRQGDLEIEWAYSTRRHRREDVVACAEECIRRLREIVEHCRAAPARLTPADVPLSGLAAPELSAVQDASQTALVDVYPATPLQAGLVFYDAYAPKAGMYVNQLSVEVDDIDVAAFSESWRELIARHPILRTAFRWGRISDSVALERPLQVVCDDVPLAITESDWTQRSRRDIELAWDRLLDAERTQGFDLTEAPLLRLQIAHLPQQRSRVLWTRHHILLDGWCTAALISELIALYKGRSVRSRANGEAGTSRRLPPAASYRMFVEWLASRSSAVHDAAEQYWQRVLADVVAPTPLPTPDGAADVRSECRRVLPTRLAQDLSAVARQQQLTPSAICQALWAVWLSRRSAEHDVIFGVTHAGRPSELVDVERMLGLFINSLPARTRVSSDQTLVDVARQLQAMSADAQAHQWLPLADIQQITDVPATTPLFGSLVVYENFPISIDRDRLAGFDLSTLDARVSSHFPLMLVVTPGQSWEIRLQGNGYTQAQVERYVSEFEHLLQTFVADPTQFLGNYDVVSPVERASLLAASGVKRDYAVSGSLVDALRSVCARGGAGVAARSGDETLSYAGLWD